VDDYNPTLTCDTCKRTLTKDEADALQVDHGVQFENVTYGVDFYDSDIKTREDAKSVPTADSAYSFVGPLYRDGKLNADAELLLFSLAAWGSNLQREFARMFSTVQDRRVRFSGIRKSYHALLKLRKERKIQSNPQGKGKLWLITLLIVVLVRAFVLRGKETKNAR
jgi:hypothetical protein